MKLFKEMWKRGEKSEIQRNILEIYYLQLNLSGQIIDLEYLTEKERQEALNRVNQAINTNKAINLTDRRKDLEVQLLYPRNILSITRGKTTHEK